MRKYPIGTKVIVYTDHRVFKGSVFGYDSRNKGRIDRYDPDIAILCRECSQIQFPGIPLLDDNDNVLPPRSGEYSWEHEDDIKSDKENNILKLLQKIDEGR